MNEKRGSLYLVTGILIGVLIGVAVSLWILPVRYVDTEPYTLVEADKKIYRAAVASAYLVEADYNRAVTRLNLLGDGNPSEILVAQAQTMLGANGNEDQARALALLAAAINQPSIQITPLAQVYPTQTAGASTPAGAATVKAPTRTPGPTSTPRPTSTLQATQGAPFVWDETMQSICSPLPAKPLLQVIVLDAAGKPVSGVKIELSRENGGIETFFTGLYPEISSGYADYTMIPGEVYAIRVGEEGQLVGDLSAPICEKDDGSTAPGSLNLVFRQP